VASIPVPPDASRAAGRVVLLAPSALGADPDLADLRRRDPALVAWSDALAGRGSDPALWSRLLLAQERDGSMRGDDPLVSTACAAVALASAGEHDAEARQALARLRMAAGGYRPPRDLDPDATKQVAAALAALAAGGVPELEEGGDPLLA